MTTIVPGVFLGNQTDASSRDALRAAGVSHVLNVTKDCPNYFETDSQLTYMRIPVSTEAARGEERGRGRGVLFVV